MKIMRYISLIVIFLTGFLQLLDAEENEKVAVPKKIKEEQVKKKGQEGKEEAVPAWKARWELARTLSYAKKLDESIEQYGKLLAEKPELTEAKAELATVMFWKGRKDQALKLFKEIPDKDLSPEAMLAAADLYAATGDDHSKAIGYYRDHLKKNKDDQKVRLRLAETLSWDKKYDESLKEYRIIMAKLPDDIQVRRKYAMVLSWSGKHEEAARELQKTLKE